MGPDMGMPPPRGPRMGPKNEHLRVPRPKSIREVPSYLKKVIGGFLRRLFYIVKLVWDTNHWILLGMMLLTLFHGVLPVAGEYVNAAILNALAESLVDQSLVLESFIGLFVIRFAIMLFSRLVTTFDNLLNRLAGEMVANHIKVQLMTKSDEIDIARFDLPEFYENLEKTFPDLLEDYRRVYGEDQDLISQGNEWLMRILRDFCREHQIICDAERLHTYLRGFEDKLAGEQISLMLA